MPLKSALCTTLALCCLWLSGCSSLPLREDGRSLIGAEVYTKTNLHPDESRQRLYAANFQQAGLIPVCTRVRIDDASEKALEFRRVDTGREYTYSNHKTNPEPFADHLLRYFGFSCPEAEIRTLSALDRKGIEEGIAKVGMSKRGVILALGYPPKHETRNPESDNSWIYWSNRFNRFSVEFDQYGKVSRIRQ